MKNSHSTTVLRWICLLAAVAALWLSYRPVGAPYITNDGYQYLDSASNLASGSCFCTRVALFDEQIAFGRIPIPFTHFAPGYPLLIASLSKTGITIETAGYLLSALGFLAVLWLIWDLGLVLGGKPWIIGVFSLLWITHATAILYGSTVGTESLFTALLMAMASLIARDVRARGEFPTWQIVLGVTAGLAYAIRYPGLFLVAVAGLYLLVRAIRLPKARIGAAAGLAAMITIVASIMIHNLNNTGSWRGFQSSAGKHGWGAILVESIRAFIHLIIGDRTAVHFNLAVVFLAAAALALLVIFIRSIRKRDFDPVTLSEGMLWISLLACAYIGGVILAAATTLAGDFPRYYFPTYPLFLVFGALVCSSIARNALNDTVIVLLIISVIALQGRNLLVPPARPEWVLTREILAEEPQPGFSLVRWLRERTHPDDVVFAVDGQAVHYVLGRSVIAFIPPGFTLMKTDEALYHSLMHGYRSKYLIVFPNTPEMIIPEQDGNPFLRDLVSGSPPQWLKLAVQTPHAAVFECGDCAR
jgi:hypothetical protein